MKRVGGGGLGAQRAAQPSAMARDTRAEPTLTEADLKPTVESLMITTQVVPLTLPLAACCTARWVGCVSRIEQSPLNGCLWY